MVLKEQLAKQTGLSLVTTALSTLFGVASFFLLTKFLPREDIAMMGISAGFLAVISPILISPDIVLFRNYAELRKSFNQVISAFLFFWVLRTAVAMGIILIGAFLLFYPRNDFLFVYVIGAGIILNLSLLQATIQEIFYVELKQREILNLNFIYYVLFLLLLGFVYWYPQLAVYLAIWLSINLLFSLVWVVRLIRAFHFFPTLDIPRASTLLKWVLSKVAIWTHLMGSITNMVYRSDLFFLGLFSAAFITGNYTIAIMFSTLAVFFPQVLQKMCLTGLTRSTSKEQDHKLVNAFVKYNAILSLIQLVGYLLFGKFLLSLVDAQNYESIFELGLYITIGITLYNVVRPIHVYCIARADLKKYFWHVFVPIGILTIVAYSVTAYLWGAVATAQANIVVYAVMSIFTLFFAMRTIGYRPSIEWVSLEERELIKKIGKRMKI